MPKEQKTPVTKVGRRNRQFVLIDAGPLYVDLKEAARRRGISATAYLRQIIYRELREKSDAA